MKTLSLISILALLFTFVAVENGFSKRVMKVIYVEETPKENPGKSTWRGYYKDCKKKGSRKVRKRRVRKSKNWSRYSKRTDGKVYGNPFEDCNRVWYDRYWTFDKDHSRWAEDDGVRVKVNKNYTP